MAVTTALSNSEIHDLTEIYDLITGPIGSRVRIISTQGQGDGWYEGKLLRRLSTKDDVLDAVVIEATDPEWGAVGQTIRWAAIESLTVLPENPEN